MTGCDWLNIKPNTNYIISQQNVWNVEIANLATKRLQIFGCKYITSTVYERETLGIHLCSSSLLAHNVLGKSEAWPQIWLEGL